MGRLTGADTGKGRLPEPAELAAACERHVGCGEMRAPDLVGRRVVVSAGGTREPVDPVRYLGNRSSGRQGYALAATAAERGAAVTVVSANVDLPDPAGVDGRSGRDGRTDFSRRYVLPQRGGRRRRDGCGGRRLPAG